MRGNGIKTAKNLTLLEFGATWLLTFCILVAPALYNRFPLVFPDTEGYLGLAYNNYWVFYRSNYYGLLFEPILNSTSTIHGIWAVLFVQACIIGAIVVAVWREADLTKGGILFCLGVVMVTTLPWHASQLLPDAFSGSLVIVLTLALIRKQSASGTPSLWALSIALASLHFTHIGIFIAVCVCVMASLAVMGIDKSEFRRKALSFGISLTVLIAAFIIPNGIALGRWSVSPMGSMFIFARFYDDGPARVWLERHCGRDVQLSVCRFNLPSDSQEILWNHETSEINQLASIGAEDREKWRLVGELKQVVAGTVREFPFEVAKNAFAGTGRQLVKFDALDDFCPRRCHLSGTAIVRPEIRDAVDQSRQVSGTLPVGLIKSVTSIISILGIILALPISVMAWRRNDRFILCLLVATIAALVANAFMAGALSDVHGRYQSRLIFLLPLIEAIFVARFLTSRTKQPEFQPHKST